MTELTPAQRKYLRSQAHHLNPVVMIGKNGLTDEVVRSAELALAALELIKVRFQDRKDEKRDITDALAERTGSAVAGLIGHVAILYRPHAEPGKRKLTLPA